MKLYIFVKFRVIILGVYNLWVEKRVYVASLFIVILMFMEFIDVVTVNGIIII